MSKLLQRGHGRRLAKEASIQVWKRPRLLAPTYCVCVVQGPVNVFQQIASTLPNLAVCFLDTCVARKLVARRRRSILHRVNTYNNLATTLWKTHWPLFLGWLLDEKFGETAVREAMGHKSRGAP
jgi:hypothetical protein